MQTRRMIIALMLSFTVFYLTIMVSTVLFPRQRDTASHDAGGGGTPVTQPASSSPADAQPRTTTRESNLLSAAQSGLTAAAQAAAIKGGHDITPILMGNAADNSPFPMSVEVLPKGSAVRGVRLRGYKDQIKRRGFTPQPYPLLDAVPATDNPGETRTFNSFATQKVRIELKDGTSHDVPLDQAVWEVIARPTPGDERTVLGITVVAPDGRELARLTKTYQLDPQPVEAMTSDLKVTLDIANLTSEPLQAILVQQGPIGFRREDPRADDRVIMSEDWSSKGLTRSRFNKNPHHRKQVIEKEDRRINLGGDADAADTPLVTENTRVAWTAVANRYFACIMAPAGRTSVQDPRLFSEVTATCLTNILHDEERPHQDFTIEFTTRRLDLEPGTAKALAFDCYLGPKLKKAFVEVPAYQARGYEEVISASFYACAPTAMVWMMMWLLGIFERLVGNYGVAIIVLVLVVRAVLHPITKKSQVNMYKMQKDMAKLQPKLEAVRQKYANDRTKMNQAMMEVYQQEGINPAGGMLSCLPMLLQIPIWGALWAGLNYTIEMRHAPLDGWWIRDLAGPDTILHFAGTIHIPLISTFLTGPIHGINILPFLLCVSQILQTKYMPRSTTPQASGTAVDQMEQQRKMMMFMSVLFMFLLYNAPSGLNLYIMASNLFAVLEQWRIRKHLQDMEQNPSAATAVTAPIPTIVDRPARRAVDEPPARKSWLRRKWEELEKQAEEARRIQGRSRDKSK